MEPANEFQFVNSTIATPHMPQDVAVRALIRKQAMKKASATRRRDGNYGKHNLRQYPVILVAGNLPTSISEMGYLFKKSKCGFDILDLSTMATLHVNRAALAALSKSPQELLCQLRATNPWSYLSFLPSRYCYLPCLSDAANCVIAKARRVTSPDQIDESTVLSYYVKALDSLQKAIDDPAQRLQPEVLCATEILALYELLDPIAGENAWIRHTAGATRLVQLRGPRNYTTEFEKALFMSLTGSIITEAFLNNERCFLETSAWQAVARSVIKEDALISDRSSTVVELIILKTRIPCLFRDTTNIILGQVGPKPVAITKLTRRIWQLRNDLLKWHCSYKRLLRSSPEILPGSAEYDRGCKTLAKYLSAMILTSRLLGAISASERVEVEKETLTLASRMLDLDLEARSSSAASGLFMAQTVGLSEAVIATSGEWLEDEPEGNYEETDTGLIAAWKFAHWNSIIGRKGVVGYEKNLNTLSKA